MFPALKFVLTSLSVIPAVFSQPNLELEEGEPCKTIGNETWICVKIANCTVDFKENKPPICRFFGKEPIVCCPPLPGLEPARRLSRAQEACLSYTSKLCKRDRSKRGDGQVNPDQVNVSDGEHGIIGGFKSDPGKHPHMALIGYNVRGETKWLCGGTLISERYVLSAAHCSNSRTTGPASLVKLGATSIGNMPSQVHIDKILVHPEYREDLAYNDIALFRLANPLSMYDMIKPACLQPGGLLNLTTPTAAGWGRLEFAGPTSEDLMEVEMQLIETDICTRLLGTSKKIPRGIDDVTQLCAGSLSGGKDTCAGDSGGPLFVKGEGSCLAVVIGITSFGRMCGLANSPGIYTRVSGYLPWIEETVWPNRELTMQ